MLPAARPSAGNPAGPLSRGEGAAGARHPVALATQSGRQPVLAVDDAPRLSPRLLQELRFLLSYHLDSPAPVALVLCRHTARRHKLALCPSTRFASG